MASALARKASNPSGSDVPGFLCSKAGSVLSGCACSAWVPTMPPPTRGATEVFRHDIRNRHPWGLGSVDTHRAAITPAPRSIRAETRTTVVPERVPMPRNALIVATTVAIGWRPADRPRLCPRSAVRVRRAVSVRRASPSRSSRAAGAAEGRVVGPPSVRDPDGSSGASGPLRSRGTGPNTTPAVPRQDCPGHGSLRCSPQDRSTLRWPCPPGDTRYPRRSTPSRWHAFRFMVNPICRTMDPDLSMAEVLEDRAAIATGLAEPTRKRRPRMEQDWPRKQLLTLGSKQVDAYGDCPLGRPGDGRLPGPHWAGRDGPRRVRSERTQTGPVGTERCW